MTFEHVVLAVLGCYTIGREIFFHYSTHKLLDKLMSRNYSEYSFVKKQEAVDSNEEEAIKTDSYVDEQIRQQLGVMSGIG